MGHINKFEKPLNAKKCWLSSEILSCKCPIIIYIVIKKIETHVCVCEESKRMKVRVTVTLINKCQFAANECLLSIKKIDLCIVKVNGIKEDFLIDESQSNFFRE